MYIYKNVCCSYISLKSSTQTFLKSFTLFSFKHKIVAYKDLYGTTCYGLIVTKQRCITGNTQDNNYHRLPARQCITRMHIVKLSHHCCILSSDVTTAQMPAADKKPA